MKTILHVDMNSYFASVEQASNPYLRGKPIAVGGGTGGKTTIVAAASYEAKARGVKTAMPAWEAKKICPALIIVPGDMDKYVYTSSEIMKILREFTPLVEVFSIDEAFMDVTETKERFRGEIEIARSIKRKIRERFRITCTIGIGPNKLMAKLAGELKKPDGLVVLKKEDIPGKIKDLKVSELCGIGRKLTKYLGEMGIRTFGELNKYPREKLVKRFGMASGEQLYVMGQGGDDSPVRGGNVIELAKSMGHSYTLPRRTSDIDEVKSYLLRLSEQVGRRMRKGGYKGNVVHLSLGFGNFKFWGKQKKLEDYLDDGYEIYKAAEKIFDALRPTQNVSPDASSQHCTQFRFIGVSVSGLVRGIDQASLFPVKEEKKKVLKAVDEINDRYGEFKIERLSVMRTVLGRKTGMTPPERYKL